MKRIVANLGLLVSCPSFLFWHLIGAVICLPALLHVMGSADADDGGYVAVFILPVWSAFVVTSLQKDLMQKPFGFVLPGHQRVLRSSSFLAGVAVCLVAALTMLGFPGLDAAGQAAALWSSFCLAMVVYLIVTGFQMRSRNSMELLGLTGVVIVLLVEVRNARMWMQDQAIFSPIGNTILVLVLGTVMWRVLGSTAMLRRISGRRYLSIQMVWRRSARVEFGESSRRALRSKGGSSGRRWILRQFFGRIGRRPLFSWRRHLAATEYATLGYLLPVRSWSLLCGGLFLLAIVGVAGYSPPRETGEPAANALFMLVCVLGAHCVAPLGSSMLLPAGRREQLLGAITFSGHCGFAVLMASALMFTVLSGLAEVAPPLTFGGDASSAVVSEFNAGDLGSAVIPLVHLPLSMVLKVVCRRWLLVPEIALMLLALVFIIKGGVALSTSGLVVAMVLLLASWGLLVSVLFSHCFRRDLVTE